jgi:hypothetical protein
MKTLNSIVKITAALCIMGALFFSCSINDTDEYGTLVIKLPGSGSARAVSNDFIKTLSYRIEYSNDTEEKEVNHSARSSGDSVSISLSPGAWVVTLTVLNAADQEISDKYTTTVLIEGGKTNTAEFKNVQIDTSRNDITSFKITKPVSADGKFNGNNITINIPEGTKLDNMSFSVIHTGKSIKHEPNHKTLNFQDNESYTFTVTAENENTKPYTVTVTASESPDDSGYLGETLSFNGQQVYGGQSQHFDPNEPYTHNATVSAEFDIGGSGRISAGKLTFTIGTPEIISPLKQALFPDEEEINSMYNNLKLTPDNARGTPLSLSAISRESGNKYVLKRENIAANTILHTTITESVEYLYVDRDVTITAKGKDFTNKGISVITLDLNLKLRKGWNTVCRNETTTTILGKPISTISISLGNSDVKWVLELDDGSSGSNPVFPNPSPSEITNIELNKWYEDNDGDIHRYSFNADANTTYYVYWISMNPITVGVKENASSSSYIIQPTTGTKWSLSGMELGDTEKYLSFKRSSSGNVIIEVKGNSNYAIYLSKSATPPIDKLEELFDQLQQ